MMPRVLLINPWIYDFATFDFWAKPLGLLYIAESLRQKGIKVTLIDCPGTSREIKYGAGHFIKEEVPKPKMLRGIPRKYSRYGISEETFMQKLSASPRPDLVLVTSIMTYWYPGVFRVIELIHRYFVNVPIILGGIYATLCYEHARQFAGADHVFPGKAGKEFFQLLSRYIPVESGDKEDAVMNYRPAIDLIGKPHYGALTTSEGCPFNCSYCASSILNPTFQQKEYKTCFNEIIWMHSTLGLKDIAFYDDALLKRPESHFIPLMEMICQNNNNLRFHAPNGLLVREISPEVVILLKRCGFKTIRLGVETTKLNTDRMIDSKTSYGELLEAISVLVRVGFDSCEIGVYLLSGLPGQTREEVEESMRKVKEAGARPYLSEFSPVPGTRIWEEARKASPYPVEAEPLFQNPSLSPCAAEGFTIERLHWRKSILQDMGF